MVIATFMVLMIVITTLLGKIAAMEGDRKNPSLPSTLWSAAVPKRGS